MNGAPAPAPLIMGAASGLTVEQVAPFLTSLRNSGYAGAVVLFVDRGLRRALRRAGMAAGVTLIPAPQWPPFKFRLLERRRLMRFVWIPIRTAAWTALQLLRLLPCREQLRLNLLIPVAHLVYTPMETRFLRYRRFLASRPHARVLLTDVRDVVFQSDPFAGLPVEGLAVSLETASYTVATEAHNAAWIKRAYGRRMLAEIGPDRVSCVGVTCGDAAAISAYLRLMSEELLKLSPRAAGVGGADTAIHNALLWTGRLGQVHRLEPLASAVATLNGVDEADLRLSPAGRLLNDDGSEVSVVHQYDRVPELRVELLRVLAS